MLEFPQADNHLSNNQLTSNYEKYNRLVQSGVIKEIDYTPDLKINAFNVREFALDEDFTGIHILNE